MIRILSALLLVLCLAGVSRATEETLTFGRFGTVTIYRQNPHPGHVVLFVSGDGGWNKGVVDMARELAGLDTLVVGIDIRHYLRELEAAREECSYPAADFEALSQYLQKKLDFPSYTPPVLVGYSSGATLVYATLVQAPPNTFLGAISLGFCPDLLITKPFCKGQGIEFKRGPHGRGVSFLPAKKLEEPWIAFQGTIDQVCDPAATEAYVKKVSGGEIVTLPKVGHGFSVPKHWLPQFKESFMKVAHQPLPAHTEKKGELAGLPLVLVQPKGDAQDASLFAVILSGDGGWASIDRQLGNTLAGEGIAVVGLNSLEYFWKKRDPDGASRDLERILRHYLAVWNKKKVILVGYSRGADVLPFMANRLPEDLLDQVSVIALLGPGQSVQFKFHVTDWLGGGGGKDALPTLPEVQKLRGKKILCFYGIKEKNSLCPLLDKSFVKSYAMSGAHHLGGEYDEMARMILAEAR
jgi:type IV secretory pathway VirJ component